jgi:serine/threonine-protein kinase RsbW
MTTPATITIPARLEYLPKCIDFISSYAGEQGFSGKRLNEIELAAEEAVVNIFNYAYKASRGEVKITCKVDETKFIIEIADTGVPFNVLSIADPDIKSNIMERREGGLGIFLIKKFVDDIQYRREDDVNKLTFIFIKELNKVK